MANKPKSKRRQPKKKASPRTNATNTMVPSKPATRTTKIPAQRVPRGAVERICAVTDPFCNHARGSRWSDGQSNATVPFSSRYHLPIITYGNGGNLIFATPWRSPLNILASTSFSAPNYTMAPGFLTSCPTDLSTYFTGIRVVSAGLIIRTLTSVMNTRGYLIISRLSTMPLPSAVETAGSSIAPFVTTHPLVPGMEIPFVFRPLGTLARDFEVPKTSSTSTITDPGWDVCKIEIVGADATTTAIDVEFFYNYEMQLPSNSVLSQIAPQSSPTKPLLMDISSTVTNNAINSTHKSVESFSKFVATNAATALANAVLPGSGNAVRQIAAIVSAD